MSTRIVPKVGIAWPDGRADAGEEVEVPDEVAAELLRRDRAELAEGATAPKKKTAKRAAVKKTAADSED